MENGPPELPIGPRKINDTFERKPCHFHYHFIILVLSVSEQSASFLSWKRYLPSE
jgi:hypothetical protein